MAYTIIHVSWVNPSDVDAAGGYIDPRDGSGPAFLSTIKKAAVNPDALQVAGINSIVARYYEPGRLQVLQVSGYNAEEGLYCKSGF